MDCVDDNASSTTNPAKLPIAIPKARMVIFCMDAPMFGAPAVTMVAIIACTSPGNFNQKTNANDTVTATTDLRLNLNACRLNPELVFSVSIDGALN